MVQWRDWTTQSGVIVSATIVEDFFRLNRGHVTATSAVVGKGVLDFHSPYKDHNYDHKVYNNDEVSPPKKYIPCIDCAVMFVHDQEVLGLRMLYRCGYRDISPTRLIQNWDLNQVKC